MISNEEDIVINPRIIAETKRITGYLSYHTEECLSLSMSMYVLCLFEVVLTDVCAWVSICMSLILKACFMFLCTQLFSSCTSLYHIDRELHN